MAGEENKPQVAGMKPQVYKDPRPAEYFTRFHERVRTSRPDWMYEVVRLVLTPYLFLIYRARCIDSHYIPADGPAIVAPNHFSFLDHFFVAVFLRRKVQFMAKSQLFKRPLQFVFTHGGVFPVRRGHHDEEGFISAHAVLARGGIVVMYPEAGRSRSGELGKPRPGLGRLALESGAPVVPTAIAGSERARNWKRLQFPKVTVQYGEPLRFEKVEEPTKEQAQAASEIVFERVVEMHSPLREGGRREAIRAARAARRAAQAAGRRPAVDR
jgi:1-acyl-sn-glycerol-3-phosphate acyltransferase